MKSLKWIIILIWILSLSFWQVYSQNNWIVDSSKDYLWNKIEDKINIENKEKQDWVQELQNQKWVFNSAVDLIERRKQNIDNILQWNKDNEVDIKYKELIDQIKNNETDKEITNQVIKDLEKKFDLINNSISQKNSEIEKLSTFIENQSWDYKELLIKKKWLEDEIKNLTEQWDKLNKELEVERNKLITLQTELSELRIYKDKYQDLVKENDKLKEKERVIHTLIYIWWFLIYLIVSIFLVKFVKDVNKKPILTVWATFLFIIFLIVYTLSVNPWFAIIFIFIASSLVISFKDFLVSILSSIFVIKKFKVWDLIEVRWIKWEIKVIWPMNVIIHTIENEQISLWNNIMITEPTKIFNDRSLREIVEIELSLLREEFDEVFKWIIKTCKSLDKWLSKHWDISYSLKEKASWKLAVNMKIKTINSWDLLLRVFHENLKNRADVKLIKNVEIDENWDEKEEE